MSDSNPPPPAGPDAGLDLNAVARAGGLTVAVEPPEHPDERAHRLKQDGHDASLRRLKEGASFAIGWAVVILITYKAFTVAFDSTPEAATLASWGRTILGSVIGAFAGYVVGRKS